MKIKIILYSFLFNAMFFITGFSQENVGCRDFTQKDVEILNDNDYIPDGRFNSVKLTYGDKIQVYKPFYRGKDYMIIVSCDDNLEGINVVLSDMTRKIIYKSDSIMTRHEIKYTPEKNQNLIIAVSVDKKNDTEELPKACVDVVVGFKM